MLFVWSLPFQEFSGCVCLSLWWFCLFSTLLLLPFQTGSCVCRYLSFLCYIPLLFARSNLILFCSFQIFLMVLHSFPDCGCFVFSFFEGFYLFIFLFSSFFSFGASCWWSGAYPCTRRWVYFFFLCFYAFFSFFFLVTFLDFVSFYIYIFWVFLAVFVLEKLRPFCCFLSSSLSLCRGGAVAVITGA